MLETLTTLKNFFLPTIKSSISSKYESDFDSKEEVQKLINIYVPLIAKELDLKTKPKFIFDERQYVINLSTFSNQAVEAAANTKVTGIMEFDSITGEFLHIRIFHERIKNLFRFSEIGKTFKVLDGNKELFKFIALNSIAHELMHVKQLEEKGKDYLLDNYKDVNSTTDIDYINQEIEKEAIEFSMKFCHKMQPKLTELSLAMLSNVNLQ